MSDPMLLSGCREGNERDTVSPVSLLKIALLSKLRFKMTFVIFKNAIKNKTKKRFQFLGWPMKLT